MSSIIKYKRCIRTTRMLCHVMPNEGSMVSGNNNLPPNHNRTNDVSIPVIWLLLFAIKLIAR